MQFISFNDKFCFLTEMIMKSGIGLKEFLLFFFMYITFFSIVIVVMGAKVANDDDQGNIYAGLPEFVKIWIHNFRLAVGDLIAPNIGIWADDFVDCDSGPDTE